MDRSLASIAFLAAFLTGLALLAYGFYAPPVARGVLSVSEMQHGGAADYTVLIELRAPPGFSTPSDGMRDAHASRLVLYEDGVPLGIPHSAHDVVRETGLGAYSHWGNALLFSTSDNSDPRTNGRRYEYEALAQIDTLAILLAIALAVGGLIGLVLGPVMPAARGARALGRFACAIASAALTTVAVLVVICSLFPDREVVALGGSATHAQGYAYQTLVPVETVMGFTVRTDDVGRGFNSRLRLLEDGVEIGPAHTEHATIQSDGRGAFSHWRGALVFSASDNSDPRVNGRAYAAIIEPVPTAVTLFVGVLALALALGLSRADRWAVRTFDRPAWLMAAIVLVAVGYGGAELARPQVIVADGPSSGIDSDSFSPVLESRFYYLPTNSEGASNIPMAQIRAPYAAEDESVGPPRRVSYRAQRAALEPNIGLFAAALGGLFALRAIWLLFGGIARVPFTSVAFIAIAIVLAAGAIAQVNGFYSYLTPDSGSYLDYPLLRGYVAFAFYNGVGALHLDPRWVVTTHFALFVVAAIVLGGAVARIAGAAWPGWATTVLLLINVDLLQLLMGLGGEPLFMVFVLFHIATGLDAVRTGRARDFAFCAGWAMVAFLVRPVGIAFIAGTLVLALLIKPWGVRRAAVGLSVCLAILAAGSAPNLVRHGALTPYSIGGLAMIGHVVHFADRTAPYHDPELAHAVIDATEGISTAAGASYPLDYYNVTANEYNTLLWRKAAPAARRIIEERRRAAGMPNDEAQVTLDTDDALSLLARDIIFDKPWTYARHVAAHVFGMWRSTFARPPLMGQAMAPYAESVGPIFQASPGVQRMFNEGLYPSADVSRRWRTGADFVQPVESVWAAARGALRGGLWAIAGLTLLLCALAVWVVLRPPGTLPPRVLAAIFCSLQTWAYIGVVAMAQPGLSRYATLEGLSLVPALMLITAPLLGWTHARAQRYLSAALARSGVRTAQ